MKKTYIIAITGRSGSGKTTVSRFYSSMGLVVLDCDKFAGQALSSNGCKQELCGAFGSDLLNGDILDKKELSRRAFSSKENQQLLVGITHPYITKELLLEIEKFKSKQERLIFVDGAVIVGYDFQRYCDKIIVVSSSEEAIYSRLQKRDSISKSDIESRLKYQNTNEQLLSAADFVIENSKDTTELYKKANDILQLLQEELL